MELYWFEYFSIRWNKLFTFVRVTTKRLVLQRQPIEKPPQENEQEQQQEQEPETFNKTF
jgi:hypothetical protein